jgi:hypothetical protein
MKALLIAALALMATPVMAQDENPFYTPRAADVEALDMLGDQVYQLRVCPSRAAAQRVVEASGRGRTNAQYNHRSYLQALTDNGCAGVQAGPLRVMEVHTYTWTEFPDEAPMVFSVRAENRDGSDFYGVALLVF